MAIRDKYSVQYAFTVTLKPKKWFVKPAEEQYDGTSMPLAEFLKSISHRVTLVTELTKNFCVHYHGVIDFRILEDINLRKRFHDAFRTSKDFGYVNIKQIDDLDGWIEYINKSLADTSKAINRRPIIIDEHNTFSEQDMANFGCTW